MSGSWGEAIGDGANDGKPLVGAVLGDFTGQLSTYAESGGGTSLDSPYNRRESKLVHIRGELVAPPRLLRELSASQVHRGCDVVEDGGDITTHQRYRADGHEGDEGKQQSVLSQILPLFARQAIADPKNKLCHFSFLPGSCPLPEMNDKITCPDTLPAEVGLALDKLYALSPNPTAIIS